MPSDSRGWLLVVGGVLRVGAMFTLGHRLNGLVAIQEDHTLVTTSLYRVIRHPSFLGAGLGLVGWVLGLPQWDWAPDRPADVPVDRRTDGCGGGVAPLGVRGGDAAYRRRT